MELIINGDANCEVSLYEKSPFSGLNSSSSERSLFYLGYQDEALYKAVKHND